MNRHVTDAWGQGFRQNLIRESFDKLSWQVSGFTVARQPMICAWFPFNAGFDTGNL